MLCLWSIVRFKKSLQYSKLWNTSQQIDTLWNNRSSCQYASVSGFDSEPCLVIHGVPQGSVLGPLLFIIFINDLYTSVRHSQMLHFADDTNLLYSNKPLKKINKHINHNISLVVQWLRSNKINLNADKIEIIIFRSKRKQITKYLNFQISG